MDQALPRRIRRWLVGRPKVRGWRSASPTPRNHRPRCGSWKLSCERLVQAPVLQVFQLIYFAVELVGLQEANYLYGSQHYPACVQIRVVSDGKVKLPGGVSMPGLYSAVQREKKLIHVDRILGPSEAPLVS